jgi:threonine dehydrogenase-like Zn-dependent dehydrogenase
VNHCWSKAGETVAVVGCGAIGLLIVQVAVQRGMRVLAHDLASEKVALAASFGAERADGQDMAQLWQDREVSTVFECAGAAKAVEACVAAAPRGSEVVLLGLDSKPVSIVPFRLVREGISIETSLIYDHPADFAHCIELVAEGALRPGSAVTHTFPLEDMREALDLACAGTCGKIHITIGRQGAA